MEGGYFSVTKSARAKQGPPVFYGNKLQFHLSNNAVPALSDLFLFVYLSPFASLWVEGGNLS